MLTVESSIFPKEATQELMKYIDALEGDVYRAIDNRRTVKVKLDGEFYFIKSHRGFSLTEWLKNLSVLKKTIFGASREWQILNLCKQHGVPSIEPVAFMHQSKKGLHDYSFLVTRSLEDTQSLEEVGIHWKNNPPVFQRKKAVITKLALIVRAMHAAGIAHRDCYLCHFLLKNKFLERKKLNPSIFVIDLHRAIAFKQLPSRWRIKDLSQLYFSAYSLGLNKHDFHRFLKIYFDAGLRDVLAQNKNMLRQVSHQSQDLYAKFHRKYEKEALRTTNQIHLIKHSSQLKPLTLGHVEPFAIQLDGYTECLIVDEVLRTRPGKRIVVSGKLHERAVVAKIYYECGKAWLHAQREYQGYQLLKQAEIDVPRCVFMGKVVSIRARVIIFEKISSLKNIAEHKMKFLEKMIPQLAKLHQHQLMQHDSHPDNYLFTDHKLYVIDTSDVRQQESLSQSDCLQQLADMLEQLQPLTDETSLALMNEYVAQREFSIELPILQAHLRKAKHARITLLMSRVMRACKGNYLQQNWCQRLLLRENHLPGNAVDMLAHPEQFFEYKDFSMLKDGGSATVIRSTVSQQPVVIKRYNIKNWWHKLRRCCQATRAANSWYFAHFLEYINIPTAKPLAMIEKRFGPLRSTAYFFMEDIAGVPLPNFWRNAGEAEKQDVLTKIINILQKLRFYNLVHGDLKATNFMINDNDVYLIDLDGMSRSLSPTKFERLFNKDLTRFLANWSKDSAEYAQIKQALSILAEDVTGELA